MKIYVCAFLIAALRIAGLKSDVFKDLAHFFVGGMYFAYFKDWCPNHWTWLADDIVKDKYLRTGVLLTLLEVVCFLAFKYLPVPSLF